jgi:hypothetical protein
MAVLTTETTITFKPPFRLSSFDRPQPYRLAIDKEEIQGLSFLAYPHLDDAAYACHLGP